MEFSEKQLSTLSNRFAREKMQQASQQPRDKKPRIPCYKKVDITTLSNESVTMTRNTKSKGLFTYVFGKKTYINESDLKYYEGFEILYE